MERHSSCGATVPRFWSDRHTLSSLVFSSWNQTHRSPHVMSFPICMLARSKVLGCRRLRFYE